MADESREEVDAEFTGARQHFPLHDFERFHRDELPALLKANGHLAADDVAELGSISFGSGGGEGFTYQPCAGGVEVFAGAGEAETSIVLAPEDFSDFLNEIFTTAGLAHGGKLRFERGGLEVLQRWEPALRALFHGRPIWTEASAACLVDAVVTPLDLSRTFTPDDSDEEMRAFLEVAGFLHVRGVYTSDEVAALGDEIERVRGQLKPGAGDCWWSVNGSGEQVVTRINYVGRISASIGRFSFDERVQRYGKLLGQHFRVCDDRLDGPMVFIKNSDIAQGLGDLQWHQDDGLGGHSVMCPLMQIGVQLDAANPQNGQLWVLAGSHRHSKHPMEWGAEGKNPVVKIETQPGDVTVHYGDLFHTTPAPTGERAGRRVLYYKFAEPKTFEMIPPGAHFNDLLFNAGAGGRVATRADTWSEDDEQGKFQVAGFEERAEPSD